MTVQDPVTGLLVTNYQKLPSESDVNDLIQVENKNSRYFFCAMSRSVFSNNKKKREDRLWSYDRFSLYRSFNKPKCRVHVSSARYLDTYVLHLYTLVRKK